MRQIFIFVLLIVGFPALAKEQVDVAIVLATDVSSSIVEENDRQDYSLQLAGIARALRDPELGRVLEQCNGNGVAVTYMEWSGSNLEENIKQVLGWRKLNTAADLKALANDIDKIKFRSSSGSTDIKNALKRSAEMLQSAPYAAARQLISISSDGEQNVSPNEFRLASAAPLNLHEDLARERDRIIAMGIVIDALVIKHDKVSLMSGIPLPEYFERYVVGGPGHFVVPVEDFVDYAAGLTQKLKRELDNCGY